MSAQSDDHQSAVEDAVSHHKEYLAGAALQCHPCLCADDWFEDLATLVVINDYARRDGRLRFRKAVGRLHVMPHQHGDRLDAAPMTSVQGCARDTMHVLHHMLPLGALSQELYTDISARRCSGDQLRAPTCAVAVAQLHSARRAASTHARHGRASARGHPQASPRRARHAPRKPSGHEACTSAALKAALVMNSILMGDSGSMNISGVLP